MTKRKRLYGRLSRPAKTLLGLLLLCLLAFALWLMDGAPTTPERMLRRMEKAHLVGPAVVMGEFDTEQYHYDRFLFGEDTDGVVFYAYDQGRNGRFFWREKTGDLTVCAEPALSIGWDQCQEGQTICFFAFDDFPAAVRAEVEIDLSFTLHVHSTGIYTTEEQHTIADGEKTYEKVKTYQFAETVSAAAVREQEGVFLFKLTVPEDANRAEKAAFAELMCLSGNNILTNSAVRIPVRIRLYDSNNALVCEREREIAVSYAPPKEN